MEKSAMMVYHFLQDFLRAEMDVVLLVKLKNNGLAFRQWLLITVLVQNQCARLIALMEQTNI
jgi:hypothetical protein